MVKLRKMCEECDDSEIIAPFNPGKVYQEQLRFKEIWLNGDINDTLIEKAIVPILNFNKYDDEMEKNRPACAEEYVREPIKIMLHTSGGEITPCMSLISAIESSKTPVHTIGLGKVYSAGFLILLAGHERYAQEHSSLMIHPGSAGFIGTIPSILKHADYIHDLQERILGYIAEHSYIELEELHEMCATEYDWYMGAEEALCRGVIDGMIVGQKVIDADMYIEAKEAEEAKAKAAEEKKVVKKKSTKKTKEEVK